MLMRILLLISFFVSKICFCQNTFIEAGLDYRTYPIDVEDAPRGPLPTSTYGSLTGDGFWKTLSIHGRFGIKTKKNWLFSVALHSRYNHNHFIEDPHIPNSQISYYYNENAKDKKKIKFDVFAEVEKKIKIKRNQEKYLTILGGLGFVNINSQTDITYLKNNISGNPPQLTRYKGSFKHFGPKFSLGYQYKRIKSSIDTYVIEDPGLTNYTSLWFGASLSYELMLKSKKRK